MSIPKRILLVLSLGLSGASFCHAQSTDLPVDDPEPVIEVVSAENEDTQIDARIENILTRIQGLKGVSVDVNSGVVTLSGNVSNEALAVDALDIAIRTAGVVTVEDNISRTLDVKGNVTPVLEGFRDSIHDLGRALPLILLAMSTFVVFIFVGGGAGRLTGLWRKIAPNPFLAELLSQAVRFFIIGAGALIALNFLGASKFITTILGGAGVVGIAIGFAVRDSLENYISSIMLSLKQPFRSSDHVVIGEHEGVVVRLTSRATILMTLDGNHLRIPNSQVFKGVILNYTTNPERRFDFELGVDADDNPIAAMQVGLDAIESHEFVLKDPSPGAIITSVGDSNIVIKFMAWVDQQETDFGKSRSIAITSAKTALESEGFTLPEPIYRLRFDASIKQFMNAASPLETDLRASTGARFNKEKAVTGSREIDQEALDVSPDTHIAEKVIEEQAQGAQNDLLDSKRPAE